MKRLAALAAIAACLLPAVALGWTTHVNLDATATWLAQRPVYVKCSNAWETSKDSNFSFWGAVAYVRIMLDGKPDDHMVVAWPWCDVLEHRTHYTPRTFATAVLILTHESGHLRGGPGWTDERRINCWALRRAGAVAELRLGLPHEARPWFDALVLTVYNEQPFPYKSSACLPH